MHFMCALQFDLFRAFLFWVACGAVHGPCVLYDNLHIYFRGQKIKLWSKS